MVFRSKTCIYFDRVVTCDRVLRKLITHRSLTFSKLNWSRYCGVVCVRHPQAAVCQHVQSLHTGCQLLAAEKALLMKLRKSTGYTFTNCKKALEKFDNDITQVHQTPSLCFNAFIWSWAGDSRLYNVISVFTNICFVGNETCLIFEMALDIFASLPIDSFSFIVLKNINKTSCL